MTFSLCNLLEVERTSQFQVHVALVAVEATLSTAVVDAQEVTSLLGDADAALEDAQHVAAGDVGIDVLGTVEESLHLICLAEQVLKRAEHTARICRIKRCFSVS